MIKEAWQNFLKGDELSFTKIYHAYFNELFAYALKIGVLYEILWVVKFEFATGKVNLVNKIS